MKVGSLFSGIGGFELGLQMASPDFEIAWQVEQDEFCQQVLAKHWPDARRWDDVKTFPPDPVEDWAVDLICGGWPCQPVSVASSERKGFRDDRWLWPEFLRICTLLQPRWVLGENVPGLLSAVDPVGRRGGLFGTVLRDLASLGYRVEYHCIPAASLGAPHRRDRVWLVGRLANAAIVRCDERSRPTESERQRRAESAVSGAGVPDANSKPTGMETHRGGRQGRQTPDAPEPAVLQQSDGTTGAKRSRTGGSDVPDANEPRLEGHSGDGNGIRQPGWESPGPDRTFATPDLLADSRRRSQKQWAVEPDVGRVAHGIPARVDRLRGLGNAVVPQVVEYLGRCVMEYENDQ